MFSRNTPCIPIDPGNSQGLEVQGIYIYKCLYIYIYTRLFWEVGRGGNLIDNQKSLLFFRRGGSDAFLKKLLDRMHLKAEAARRNEVGLLVFQMLPEVVAVSGVQSWSHPKKRFGLSRTSMLRWGSMEEVFFFLPRPYFCYRCCLHVSWGETFGDANNSPVLSENGAPDTGWDFAEKAIIASLLARRLAVCHERRPPKLQKNPRRMEGQFALGLSTSQFSS